MEILLEKIEKYARARSQTHVSLVTIVGGYLLYLAYDMIKSFLNGTGGSSTALYIFAALFVVCGLLLCGGGLYSLWKGWYKENTPVRKEEADMAPENGESSGEED